MNAPHRLADWSAANQRLLSAEFARLKHRLRTGGAASGSEQTEEQNYKNEQGQNDEDEPEQGQEHEQRREHAPAQEEASGPGHACEQACQALRAAMPAPAAIDRLAGLFGLSGFERDVLLLCAGVEMDAGLRAACASATAGTGAAGASFGLALAVCDAPHWSAITPVHPLRRWRLIELDTSNGLALGRLHIDERILHYLAGANYLDARLHSLLQPVAAPGAMAATHQRIVGTARDALQAQAAGAPGFVWLFGNDAQGRTDVAARIAAALGVGLYLLPAADVPDGHPDIAALAILWQREALLLDSALLVSGSDADLPPPAIRFIERLDCLVFASSGAPQRVDRPHQGYRVDLPTPGEQKQLWQEALGAAAHRVDGVLDGIACQFTLSANGIAYAAGRLVPVLATSERPDSVMWSACRSLARTRLDALAQCIDAAATWDDLVVGDAQATALRQIAAQMRHRLTVHFDWGFGARGPRGLGISALFAGESGTGKTLAAEVLAHELDLDLYRIDLSAVVSKYIGETEKNLRRIFDAAEDSGAILLFDEADALFGKRSDVKDSHDRYANIEVSYLLQRIESYRGLAILTTNLKDALDVAFLRRLRFIVHFTFPDQRLREALWRNAFPARTPLADVNYGKLARLSVTGGSIRNIALNAAFGAAAQQHPVSMAHVLDAARREAGKRGQTLSEAETRGWV